MNYLGIDYGESKIGLSKASSDMPLATPHNIISGGISSIDEIKKIVQDQEIDEIIVGYPLTLKGEQGHQTQKVDEFINKLSVIDKKLHKQDERFSTKSSVSKGDDDSSAATLILQTWLDIQNSHKS